MQRRAVFRNERTFYKRKCDLCKKEIIAIYDSDALFPVYCNECWYSDNWDALSPGQGYDFSKPFFEQNHELRKKVPRVATIGRENINSSYINIGAQNKNCYFLIESSTNEDCAYGYWLLDHCKECFDCAFLRKTEIAYETQSSWESFSLAFCKDCRTCTESRFLLDCSNVANSLACVNLRNKAHHLFNQPYTKEDFDKEIAKLDLGSYKNLSALKQTYGEFILKYPRRFAYIVKSVNCSGDYIVGSNNCRNSFVVEDGDNVRYGVRIMYNVKDVMDADTIGIGAELCYESINTAIGVYNMKFCTRCWTGKDSQYCDNCDNISSCFGCIGLRQKKYCILNQQYSKGEYEKLLPRIITQMHSVPYIDVQKKAYRYGEFFPAELSPFAYNETAAQKYVPLTEETANEQGFAWKSYEKREYEITLQTNAIPDHIRDASDSIIHEIIACEHAGTCNEQCPLAFRISSQELTFYRKMNIPLPRLCPNCRHYQRQKMQNPNMLWQRPCQCAGTQSESRAYQNLGQHFHDSSHCPNEFLTSYSLEKPEIVYCEQCYQAEIM